ncbi:MAG TPA: hypothetical protein VNW94_15785, partial [Streptosporangiaceae bacterium]|nr:hypothetical protein [Streptosporangiaceae bacterium]
MDVEVVDVLRNSKPSELKSLPGYIKYDLRRFEVKGRSVSEYTVRLHHKLDPGVPPEQVAQQVARAQQELAKVLARGHRLPSGDQLHIRVEFVDDPGQAHATAYSVSPGKDRAGKDKRSHQTEWLVSDPPSVLVHEWLHYLGLYDESLERGEDAPIFQSVPDQGTVVNDDSIMGSRLRQNESIVLLPRHLWQIERVTRSQVTLPETGQSGEIQQEIQQETRHVPEPVTNTDGSESVTVSGRRFEVLGAGGGIYHAILGSGLTHADQAVVARMRTAIGGVGGLGGSSGGSWLLSHPNGVRFGLGIDVHAYPGRGYLIQDAVDHLDRAGLDRLRELLGTSLAPERRAELQAALDSGDTRVLGAQLATLLQDRPTAWTQDLWDWLRSTLRARHAGLVAEPDVVVDRLAFMAGDELAVVYTDAVARLRSYGRSWLLTHPDGMLFGEAIDSLGPPRRGYLIQHLLDHLGEEGRAELDAVMRELRDPEDPVWRQAFTTGDTEFQGELVTELLGTGESSGNAALWQWLRVFLRSGYHGLATEPDSVLDSLAMMGAHRLAAEALVLQGGHTLPVFEHSLTALSWALGVDIAEVVQPEDGGPVSARPWPGNRDAPVIHLLAGPDHRALTDVSVWAQTADARPETNRFEPAPQYPGPDEVPPFAGPAMTQMLITAPDGRRGHILGADHIGMESFLSAVIESFAAQHPGKLDGRVRPEEALAFAVTALDEALAETDESSLSEAATFIRETSWDQAQVLLPDWYVEGDLRQVMTRLGYSGDYSRMLLEQIRTDPENTLAHLEEWYTHDGLHDMAGLVKFSREYLAAHGRLPGMAETLRYLLASGNWSRALPAGMAGLMSRLFDINLVVFRHGEPPVELNPAAEDVVFVYEHGTRYHAFRPMGDAWWETPGLSAHEADFIGQLDPLTLQGLAENAVDRLGMTGNPADLPVHWRTAVRHVVMERLEHQSRGDRQARARARELAESLAPRLPDYWSPVSADLSVHTGVASDLNVLATRLGLSDPAALAGFDGTLRRIFRRLRGPADETALDEAVRRLSGLSDVPSDLAAYGRVGRVTGLAAEELPSFVRYAERWGWGGLHEQAELGNLDGVVREWRSQTLVDEGYFDDRSTADRFVDAFQRAATRTLLTMSAMRHFLDWLGDYSGSDRVGPRLSGLDDAGLEQVITYWEGSGTSPWSDVSLSEANPSLTRRILNRLPEAERQALMAEAGHVLDQAMAGIEIPDESLWAAALEPLAYSIHVGRRFPPDDLYARTLLDNALQRSVAYALFGSTERAMTSSLGMPVTEFVSLAADLGAHPMDLMHFKGWLGHVYSRATSAEIATGAARAAVRDAFQRTLATGYFRDFGSLSRFARRAHRAYLDRTASFVWGLPLTGMPESVSLGPYDLRQIVEYSHWLKTEPSEDLVGFSDGELRYLVAYWCSSALPQAITLQSLMDPSNGGRLRSELQRFDPSQYARLAQAADRLLSKAFGESNDRAAWPLHLHAPLIYALHHAELFPGVDASARVEELVRHLTGIFGHTPESAQQMFGMSLGQLVRLVHALGGVDPAKLLPFRAWLREVHGRAGRHALAEVMGGFAKPIRAGYFRSATDLVEVAGVMWPQGQSRQVTPHEFHDAVVFWHQMFGPAHSPAAMGEVLRRMAVENPRNLLSWTTRTWEARGSTVGPEAVAGLSDSGLTANLMNALPEEPRRGALLGDAQQVMVTAFRESLRMRLDTSRLVDVLLRGDESPQELEALADTVENYVSSRLRSAVTEMLPERLRRRDTQALQELLRASTGGRTNVTKYLARMLEERVANENDRGKIRGALAGELVKLEALLQDPQAAPTVAHVLVQELERRVAELLEGPLRKVGDRKVLAEFDELLKRETETIADLPESWWEMNTARVAHEVQTSEGLERAARLARDSAVNGLTIAPRARFERESSLSEPDLPRADRGSVEDQLRVLQEEAVASGRRSVRFVAGGWHLFSPSRGHVALGEVYDPAEAVRFGDKVGWRGRLFDLVSDRSGAGEGDCLHQVLMRALGGPEPDASSLRELRERLLGGALDEVEALLPETADLLVSPLDARVA